MDVGTFLDIQVRQQLIRSLSAHSLRAKVALPFLFLEPCRYLIAALSGIILQADGAEHQWQRRGRRRGPGDWQVAQIGTNHIELCLMKFEAGEGGHVGRVNRKPGAFIALEQVSVGGSLEERLIQYL